MGMRFLLGGDENVLELGSDDRHRIFVNLLKTNELYSLKR